MDTTALEVSKCGLFSGLCFTKFLMNLYLIRSPNSILLERLWIGILPGTIPMKTASKCEIPMCNH